jgi:hypothetical protein
MRWACGQLVIVAVLGLAGCDERSTGQFPELRPVLEAPDGYTLTFRDGPDFYTWVLAEDRKVGGRHRSGVGIYFGLYPNLKVDESTADRLEGRLCSRDVVWWVERSDDPKDPWIRRDVVIDYEHGPGFRPIKLHCWIWGQTEEQVGTLARRVGMLSFVDRR